MNDDRPEPTEEDARIALRDHVIERAAAARRKYGEIDAAALAALLADREVVRYPTAVRFDDGALLAGEFAHAEMVGSEPREGYCVYVHPRFEARPELLPALVAYHLVRVNYGDIATHVEAELFGATLLGMPVDAYYEMLCDLVDEPSP